MSQNKTVFPGLGQEGDFNPDYQSPSYGGSQEYYRRPSSERAKGTVFPGMESHVEDRGQGTTTSSTPKNMGKPIVGFLYSISRTGIGEYWPLHIGQNIIGNSEDCDIILGEATVSHRHANLHINKMKKPEKVEATITDLGSTVGTLVNGNSVSMVHPIECVNHDIITIGDNYDLLLLLVDAKALGLHLSEKFYSVREDQYDQGPTGFSDGRDGATRNDQDFPPRFDGPDTRYTEQTVDTDGTVGLDDTSGGIKRGKTTF